MLNEKAETGHWSCLPTGSFYMEVGKRSMNETWSVSGVILSPDCSTFGCPAGIHCSIGGSQAQFHRCIPDGSVPVGAECLETRNCASATCQMGLCK
jgi:hypothetical protein